MVCTVYFAARVRCFGRRHRLLHLAGVLTWLQIENFDTAYKAVTDKIEALKGVWEPKLEEKIALISEQFQEYFSNLKCAGAVKLDKHEVCGCIGILILALVSGLHTHTLALALVLCLGGMSDFLLLLAYVHARTLRASRMLFLAVRICISPHTYTYVVVLC